jgi:hypothetical protein
MSPGTKSLCIKFLLQARPPPSLLSPRYHNRSYVITYPCTCLFFELQAQTTSSITSVSNMAGGLSRTLDAAYRWALARHVQKAVGAYTEAPHILTEGQEGVCMTAARCESTTNTTAICPSSRHLQSMNHQKPEMILRVGPTIARVNSQFPDVVPVSAF